MLYYVSNLSDDVSNLLVNVNNLSPIAPYEKVSEAIAHFLNCLLGQADVVGWGWGGGEGGDNMEDTTIAATLNGHTTSKKKQKKKKNTKSRLSSGLSLSPSLSLSLSLPSKTDEFVFFRMSSSKDDSS